MNFKRFISGVSAFAMASSVFAGLAVTASAAEETKTLTSTAAYVTTGTELNAASDTVLSNNTQFRSSSSTALGTVKFNKDGSLPIYSFDISELSGTVTSATVKFTVNGTGDGKDSYNLVAVGYTGDLTTLSNSSSSSSSDILSGLATETKYPFQPLDSTTTFGTGTSFPVDKEVSAIKYVNSAVAGELDTVNIAVINNSTRSVTFSATATLEVTTSDTAVPAGEVTVKYVASGSDTSIKADTKLDTELKFANDEISFSYPAYIEYESKLYKSVSDEYSKTVELTDSSQEIKVEYTAQDADVFQYAEFDGDTNITNVNKASNGAMQSGINGGIAAMTVAEDGEYTVIIATGRNDQESTSTRYGTWDVNGENSQQLKFAAAEPGEQKYEKVMLKANDIINVKGNNGKCALDYVVILKTGEYAAPVEPATATAEFKKDFTSETETDTSASVWALNVTAGTESITSVKVKVNDIAESNEITGTETPVITGSGNAVFAVIINKLKDDITGIDAILNGTNITAFTAE